jgi:hypothetical protein
MKTLSPAKQQQVKGGIAAIVLSILGVVTVTVVATTLIQLIKEIVKHKP